MTKRILCYGDSNTWGTPDTQPTIRYEKRWPKTLISQLADPALELVEDAIPGRTTALDDYDMADTRFLGDPTVANGFRSLLPSLRAHAPLDLVVLMLGTNDLKSRYCQTPRSIAANVERIARRILTSNAGPGPWGEGAAPKLLILCPAQVGERIKDPAFDRKEEWGMAQSIMAALPPLYKAVADELRADFFDIGPLIEPGATDPFHWPEDQHVKLGSALAPIVRDMLDRDIL